MDSQSIEIYKKALEDGSEKDHSVRLMVVGPYDVGKTALTKRLLQEDVDIDERESTDGIDIHVGRCKVSLETKEWKIEPISKVAEDFTAQRIAKVLQRPEENLNRSLGRNTGETFENRFADKMRTDDDISKGNSELPETLVDKGERGPFDRSPSGRNTGEEQAKVEENNIHLEQIKEVVAASERPVSDNASVSVWDFGGQSVFYSTHQMFLSHRAIYILVNDMSKMIEAIKMADQPHFDCKETESLKIEDFLDIWLYSIHGQSKGSHGVPPIILVGTKADKLESVDRTKKMDRFFKAIRNRFADKPLIRSHFINKNFGLSNVRIDPNLEDLRTAIIEQAEKQSYWGKELPAKWIPLEKVLYDLRKNKVQIISLEEFEKLNQKLAAPITRDDELQLFLEFHHDIGNIMYFKVPELKGKIVLSPQFLVNALKSLITAEEFLENDPVINWREFAGQGKLTTSLLDAVWNKGENKEFQENREHILALMERLNIIAKPVAEDGKSPENSATQGDGFYFVPCMLKECPLEATLLNKPEYISTSWLCLKLKRGAFPGAIFNRLLAGCISKWTLARTGPKYHIYRGCGQFVLDEEDQHTLTMSFLCNIIALSVTKYGEKNKYPDVNICQGVYSIVQEILKGIGKCLSIDIEFDEYIQCPYGPNFEGRCLHSVQKLKKTNEFPCRMHDKPRMIHSSDLLKYWFDSKEVADQIPTEKQLGKIAHRIGKEFEALAIELGISQARIDQIKIEYPGRAVDQTRRILLEWKTKMANLATFRELERAMEVVKINSQDVFRAI